MKTFISIYKRCLKNTGAPFLFICLFNVVFCCISQVLTYVAPAVILKNILDLEDLGQLDSIINILLLLFLSNVLGKYFSNTQSKKLFLFRLGEIAFFQKSCLNMPIDYLENGEGKSEIEYAIQALTSGNDYGIEAYLVASLNLIMAIFNTTIYLILFSYVPKWFYLVILLEIILKLPYQIKFNKTATQLSSENASNKIKLENFRRVILQDNFAKDSRIFNSHNFIKEELTNRTSSQNEYAKILSSMNNKKTIFSSIVVLIKNLLFVVLCTLNMDTIEVGNIAIYMGFLAGIDLIITQITESVFKISLNKKPTDDFINFMSKYEETLSTSKISKGISTTTKATKLLPNDIVFKFDDVNFSYGNQNIFKNISFEIGKNQKIAIVGENGVGKTTLVKLLLGVLKPTKGNIYINGQDIKKLDINDYWKNVSAIFQNSSYLSFTLKENIACESIDKIDETQLYKILTKVKFDEKVSKLKDGINSYCSFEYNENGVDFSGGEKQKIFMARMIKKDADIIILDEPTSSLDAKVEAEVYNLYNQLTKDKLSFFVSHRLGTTKFCDKIMFIENTQNIIIDTFENLYNKNYKFKNMYDTQTSYYKDGGVVHEN